MRSLAELRGEEVAARAGQGRVLPAQVRVPVAPARSAGRRRSTTVARRSAPPRTSTSIASTTASPSTATTVITCNGSRRVRAGETITAADGYGRWRVYDRRGRRARARSSSRRVSTLAHEPPLAAAPHGRVLAHQGREARARGPEAHRARRRPRSAGGGGALGRALGRRQGGGGARPAAARRPRSRRAVAAGRGCRWSTARSRLAELAALPGLVVAAVDGVRRRRPPGAPGAASGWWRSGPRAASTPTSSTAFGAAPRLAVGPFVLRAETAAIAAAAALAGPAYVFHLSVISDRREW